MNKIILTNISSKLLCIIMSLATLSFSILITFFADEFNIFATLFMIFVTSFCLFATYISFNHKIIIKSDKMVLKNLITQTIKFEDINSIHSNITGNFIVFETKDRSIVLAGYSMIFKKKKQSNKNEEIIVFLNTFIKKN